MQIPVLFWRGRLCQRSADVMDRLIRYYMPPQGLSLPKTPSSCHPLELADRGESEHDCTSSRGGSWKPKSWYCDISSMSCSSRLHLGWTHPAKSCSSCAVNT